MKLYISADIEGVAGIAHWNETDKNKGDYREFGKQMTQEVLAVCKGAKAAGVKDIWIKDAHDSARNMDPSAMPMEATLVRGWSGHPFMMMQEIDETFDAAIMVGYHSGSGSGGNPLSHTLTGRATEIRLNGQFATEFLVNAYTAAYVGVPTILVAGDWELATHVKKANGHIRTVGVNKGVGDSSISIHPQVIVEQIEKATKEALSGNLQACLLEMPESFVLEVDYAKAIHAYKSSFYPGASLVGDRLVRMEADDYMDILRFLMFAL